MIQPRINIKIIGNPNLDKQNRFALAVALTKTAKEGQASIVKSLRSHFSIRNNWPEQSNVYGVRVKPATKETLTTWIGTAADWLDKFVEAPAGSTVIRTPQGGEYLAIPTTNIKRTKREIIRAMQRPRALKGKRDVVLPMKNGRGMVLFQRRGRGRGSQLVALYVLVKRAKIKELDVLEGPAVKVFENRFSLIFQDELARAYATAK